MRALEPWVDPPLTEFLRESSARLVLLMTSSGQVVAQHGFTRSLDVMSVAALGAAIVASTTELARIMGLPTLGNVVHQGGARGVLLAPFAMPEATWIALVVYGDDTTIGLVQLFFNRLAGDLRLAAPGARVRAPILAERFEEELNSSLRTLFGR
ncbi:MAG TPA: roadblock/LC7 domain-containing protein [Gemmatimonadales bacterium]